MPKQQIDASQINSFQQDTQRKVASILAERGQSGRFAIVELPPEPFGAEKTNELAIKLTVSGYELWVYADGANVLGDNVDKRFEISDYNSLADLQSGLLEFFRELLR